MQKRTILLAVILVFTVACGGKSGLSPSTDVSGPYEFIVTSNVSGSMTLVEANLASDGRQISASGPTQVQILTLAKKVWYVNGVCPGATPGKNSVVASLDGNNVVTTFNVGGNAFGGPGVLTGSTINGNYSVTGSKCPDLVGLIGFPPGVDSGGFVGNQVPELAGTYTGTLTLPNGTDNAALTLMERPDHTLTVNAALTGPVDNGNFTLTGSAVGNIMIVSGPVSGGTLSLFGYLDRVGTYTGLPNSILVFDHDTLATAGVLQGRQ